MSEQIENRLSEKNIGRFLGKTSPRISQYDPELLVQIPRAVNRAHLGLDINKHSLHGVDIWTAYEISFLLDSSLPAVGVMQFSVPADSAFIVESKSVKLYLSSFNSEKMGPDVPSAIEAFCDRVAADVSAKTEAAVTVRWIEAWDKADWKQAFPTLEAQVAVDADWTALDDVALEVIEAPETTTLRWHSALLRSQCRITQQPDWGDVYIEIRGQRFPTDESLLKTILVMRDEEHFHEEIVEALYAELLKTCEPEGLIVYAQYTRRGGVDINPLRCTSEQDFADIISGPFPIFKPCFRQ